MGEEERKKWAEISLKLVDEAFPENSDENVSAWEACAVLLPHALASIGYAEELGSAITGHLRNDAGEYLFGRSEFQEAKILFEGALKIDEQVYGPDHPDVARDVNCLGFVLRSLDEPQEARKCFERAIKIGEKAYGQDHTNVAIFVNNLGEILRNLGELQEARKCFERALKIDENVYGPDHADVARDLHNLGITLNDLGDRLGAKKCVKRALKICERSLGTYHSTTKLMRKNLRGLG